jgi:hypothetical protein
MSEPSPSQLAEKLKDTDAITAAVQRAAREAVLAHARAGFPVAGWQNGKVVWIPPEEILARFANGTTKT